MRLGVDVGGSKIAFGLCDEATGAFRHHWEITNQFFGCPEAMAGAVAEEILREARDFPVGVGCPGWIIDGHVLEAVNLGIGDYPLRAALEERLGRPVFLENDARCALLGEWRFGVLQGARNAAMVTFGTGIGGALLLEGRLYRGSFGCAGEIGHMTLESGGACSCGKRGCYELSACVPALLGLARARGVQADTGRAVFDRAAAGDSRAQSALDEFLDRAARGIVELAMLLDLDAVCVGGGISAQRTAFVAPLEERARVFAPHCRILPAGNANAAGVLGAACLGDFQ